MINMGRNMWFYDVIVSTFWAWPFWSSHGIIFINFRLSADDTSRQRIRGSWIHLYLLIFNLFCDMNHNSADWLYLVENHNSADWLHLVENHNSADWLHLVENHNSADWLHLVENHNSADWLHLVENHNSADWLYLVENHNSADWLYLVEYLLSISMCVSLHGNCWILCNKWENMLLYRMFWPFSFWGNL